MVQKCYRAIDYRENKEILLSSNLSVKRRLTLNVRKVLKDTKWYNNVIGQSVVAATVTFCLKVNLEVRILEIRTLSIRKVLKCTK